MKIVRNRKWKNWSHSFESTPEKIYYPKSIEEVCAIVKNAKKKQKKIRVVGAGHSFSPLVKTSNWLISLDELSGIDSIDEIKGIATVLGGTRLRDIGGALGKRGYAQENLGDINVQSIAGAISTGTHGTGLQFGNISSQVIEMTFVTASGELMIVSEERNANLFYASLVSLGSLGIIVKVKLKIVKSPIYEYKSEKIYYDHLLNNLDKYLHTNRHFEFYLFPYSNIVQIKKMNPTVKNPQSLSIHKLKNLILENYLFYLLSTVCKYLPRMSRYISNISAKGVGRARVVAPSNQLFATPRLVRFREMEYCIPLLYFKDVLQEVREMINKKKYAVHFPIECRTVKEDDIWLSPSYKRESAYIAFHMFKGMDYSNYFIDMENIMKKYEGRPHWGKMNFCTSNEVTKLYPMFESFKAIRKELDPNGMFLNEYLEEILT